MSREVSAKGVGSVPDAVSDALHLSASEEMLLGLLVGGEVDLFDVGLVGELSHTEGETELVDGVGEIEEGVDDQKNGRGKDVEPVHGDDTCCSTDSNRDQSGLVEEEQLRDVESDSG